MKIGLNSLKEGSQILNVSLTKNDLNIVDSGFVYPINVSMVVDKFSSQIFISGKLQTRADFQCDRCLNSYSQDLKADFKVVLAMMHDKDLEDENVILVSPSMNEVDITPQIRDAVILAIPLKKICSDNCQGLCSFCGANLNNEECRCGEKDIDSRWEPLKRIMKKIPEES